MKIKESMMEMFFVTDDDGEVLAGPFFFRQECYEWMEENGCENYKSTK